MSEVNIRKVPGYRMVGPHLYGPKRDCVFCGCELEIAEHRPVPGSFEPPECVPWKHTDESFDAYRERLDREGYNISAQFLELRWSDIAAWEIAAWGRQFAVTSEGLVDEAEEVTAAVRGARLHQIIEDEYAYSTGDADRVLVDGKVSRERRRGDFWTRRRIQYARWFCIATRQLLSRDTLRAAAEIAAERFQGAERRRHCPHRQEWRRFYPGHNWQTCGACGAYFAVGGIDRGGRVG